jgi:hypothetical protein
MVFLQEGIHPIFPSKSIFINRNALVSELTMSRNSGVILLRGSESLMVY